MMDPRKIILPVSGIFPLKSLINRSGEKLIFPFYHAVADNSPPHLRNLYRIKNHKEFEKDIDFLLKNFKALSPEILRNKSEVHKPSEPSFILSFDDGLRELKDVIIPVLKRKGIQAMLFLNNNFIDNKALFFRYKISILIDHLKSSSISSGNSKRMNELLNINDTFQDSLEQSLLKLKYSNISLIDKISEIIGVDFDEYLKTRKPYLTEHEVRDIIDDGFYIGSHSFDHPNFSELSDTEQLKEIVESSAEIRNRFKLDYSFFAFPFSDDGVSRMSLAKLHTMEGKPDASFGTSGLKKDLGYPHYQRISMEKISSQSNKIIKTEYFYYLLKSLLDKN